MNYLQLCQTLRRKCRVSGTGPVSVIGQNEEYARLVAFINEAWQEIQLARSNWAWMRASMSFPTVAGQGGYTPAQLLATAAGYADFGGWALDTFRAYPTATGLVGEQGLEPISYDAWRDVYNFGANRTAQGAPTCFAVMPDQGVALGMVPLAGYTVSADYYKMATALAADADIPALPAQYHMAIVYKAMMFFGVSEAQAEIYDEGMSELKTMMSRITAQQQPEMALGGAWA